MTNWKLILCILCSAGAGLGAGLFGCILSWANNEKRRNQDQHTRCSRFVAIFGVIGSTLFGLGSLAGLFFGPVTLVVVTRAGTLLPANAFFSQLFGFRPLTRDDFLGTMITLSGVVCFSIFGGTPPPPPVEKEYLVMLSSLGALICNLVLFAIFMISIVVVIAGRGRQHGPNMYYALSVSCVAGCSSAFMDVAAKGWSAVLDSAGFKGSMVSLTFWLALIINIMFLTAMRVSMIYGCKQCDVLLFVPLSTVSNILFSVLAGMVVMKEYQQVISWPGLVAASFSVLGGVVMLVTGPARKDDDESSPPSNLYAEAHEDEDVSSLVSTDDSEDDTPMGTCPSSMTRGWTGGICFSVCSFAKKGQELVQLNHRHSEVAKTRKRWTRVKQNLRDVAERNLPHFTHTRTNRSTISSRSTKSTRSRKQESAVRDEQSDSDDDDDDDDSSA